MLRRMKIEVEAIGPKAPKHNLLDSALDLPEPGDRWEAGITWEQVGCRQAVSYQQACDQETDLSGATGTSGGTAEHTPTTYYLPYECYVTGFPTEESKQRVDDLLAVAAIKGVEETFWIGLTADTPNVTGYGADATGGVINDAVTNPTALSVEEALARLGQALAWCGSGAQGMIHATPYLVNLWTQRRYICEDENGLLRTQRGDIVVSGSGYLGTGPEGNTDATPDAGTQWAYATSMVGIYKSDIRHQSTALAEVINRSDNTVRWIAEQTIGYQKDECCSFAVLVDI